MIGNDIVDLKIAAIESNWQRKGFLEKIFTLSERFLIGSAKDASTMVWLMWTMKESAYKAASEPAKIRSFAPCALDCNHLILHDRTATGNVCYQDKIYCCKSILTENYIHTIASSELETLDKIKLDISGYNASDRSYRASKPASVSHHGAFLALVYL